MSLRALPAATASLFLCILIGLLPAPALCQTSLNPDAGKWKQVWHDEFDGEKGVRPDPLVWTYDAGNDGFGNKELETYCAYQSSQPPCDPSQPNSFVTRDGLLHIVARKMQDGRYTSARLKTIGLKAIQYGRIESRIRIPEGQGIWPAFWMLGVNMPTVDWPACGELDIMENIGKEPETVHGSIHVTGFDSSSTYSLGKGQNFAAGFHTYGLLWSPGQVQYYVDNPKNVYATYTPKSLTPVGKWPFDDGEYFFLLNLAVGGVWPGSPDESTRFPQEMLVDYVRVWQQQPATTK